MLCGRVPMLIDVIDQGQAEKDAVDGGTCMASWIATGHQGN